MRTHVPFPESPPLSVSASPSLSVRVYVCVCVCGCVRVLVFFVRACARVLCLACVCVRVRQYPSFGYGLAAPHSSWGKSCKAIPYVRKLRRPGFQRKLMSNVDVEKERIRSVLRV